jgi:hypothetical protein
MKITLHEVKVLIIFSLLIALFYMNFEFWNPYPILKGQKMWLPTGISGDKILKIFENHISIGMPIENAKQILETNGFACFYTKAPKNDKVENIGLSAKDGELLYCSEYRSSQIICTYYYEGYFYYHNQRVSKIDAARGDWCL